MAPYTDEAKPGPVNTYAQSKLDMESLLLADATRTQPVVCLRSSIILGPLGPFGNTHSTFLHFCQSRQGQETTFWTDEVRSVINVNDVINVLLHFYTSMQSGSIDDIKSSVYNMGGPERVSRMTMAVAVAKECGFSHEVFIPDEKANQPTGGDNPVRSPLDISMLSCRLEDLVGLKFHGLEATVKAVFAK